MGCACHRSLGIVFYELSAQRPAFDAFNISGLVTKIKNSKLTPMPSQYSEEWQELIRTYVWGTVSVHNIVIVAFYYSD